LITGSYHVASGDLLCLQVFRGTYFAGDTLVGDVYLLGIEISYTAVR
jgi:hypothetical protein